MIKQKQLWTAATLLIFLTNVYKIWDYKGAQQQKMVTAFLHLSQFK